MQEKWESATGLAVHLSEDNLNSEADAEAGLRSAGRISRWRRNETCDAVIERGAIACVLSGSVRKLALRPNGKRQIIDFAFPGDFMGFAPPDPNFFLETVVDDTQIISYTPEQIGGLAARYPAVAALMQRCAADAIHRLELHLLVQSRTTAREKVAAYLAAMSRRVERSGDHSIALPITRYDIADYLGIAAETVSRTMTALRRGGSSALKTPRDVETRNPSIFSDREW